MFIFLFDVIYEIFKFLKSTCEAMKGMLLCFSIKFLKSNERTRM